MRSSLGNTLGELWRFECCEKVPLALGRTTPSLPCFLLHEVALVIPQTCCRGGEGHDGKTWKEDGVLAVALCGRYPPGSHKTSVPTCGSPLRSFRDNQSAAGQPWSSHQLKGLGQRKPPANVQTQGWLVTSAPPQVPPPWWWWVWWGGKSDYRIRALITCHKAISLCLLGCKNLKN